MPSILSTSQPALRIGFALWAAAQCVAVSQAGPFDHPKGYVCGKASAPIALDGKIDDQAWSQAPWTDAFVDIEGNAKPKPRFETRVKMLWDDKYFYVAAKLEEPNVWAVLSEHDSVIFQDNDFEVFIDPDGDRREYYEIEVNPIATEWDLRLNRTYRDHGAADNGWEAEGIVVKTTIDGTLNHWDDIDRGWTIEIAIPWSSLAKRGGKPIPPAEGDQWRVNFSRVEWTVLTTQDSLRKRPGKLEDNWVWSPQGVVDMHRPEHWGYVQFTSRPAAETKLALDPSSETRLRVAAVYDAQHEYRRIHGRWASDIKNLDRAFTKIGKGDPTPEMLITDDGFILRMHCPAQGGLVKTVTLNSEGEMKLE